MTYNNHLRQLSIIYSLDLLSDTRTISSAYSNMDTSPLPYDAPLLKLFTVCAKSLINIFNNNDDKMQPCSVLS